MHYIWRHCVSPADIKATEIRLLSIIEYNFPCKFSDAEIF